VVVLAVPALIVLFTRIHRYYQRAARALGRGTIPGLPQVKPVIGAGDRREDLRP